MKVRETPLEDALIVSTDPHADARGRFTRLVCKEAFSSLGLPGEFVQSSLSETVAAGTLRGMHFQRAPSAEGKLVRCLRGRIWDVIIDLRPSSATYLGHFGVLLTGESLDALWVPPGFAHGQLTLQDDCMVEYHMTDDYRPELAAGVRWNDPLFAIEWPMAPVHVNDRDASYPDFTPVPEPGR
jgi:dTDP-4-dehydrorhamnose 3,5-epimerase